MDEKLDKLIRLLIDNGISLNRVGDWFCCTELELDFSAHDKVFEDKIATLEEKLLTTTKTAEQNRCENFVLKIKNQELNQITKGYEDKIAELKKDYKTASELLGKYQQENEALKKRIQELDEIDTMRIDEKRELKQRIAELESKETSDLPFDALETANYLINATYERETSSLERVFAKVPDKVNSDRYTIDDLEQIAEHLLIYCKHNKECEE